MCDNAISEDPFIVLYYPDKYITQRMPDKAVDDRLASLKFIPDLFVKKILEKLDNTLHANDNILFNIEDFEKITLNACQRYIDIFLLQILIKLILMMITILMEMILILLFKEDFQSGVVNLLIKYLKKKISCLQCGILNDGGILT